MYQAQVLRKREEENYQNLDEFLTSLDLVLRIERADAYSLPRIAQLTQKTNQMNLTTRRYTEADIGAFIASDDRFVFAVSCDDKFGQNGIIGVLILESRDGDLCVDTFLLSCRVIGRNIEAAMLAFVAEFARARGGKRIIGKFFPTEKNRPAADMYEKMGFEKRDETTFVADPQAPTLVTPPYIRVSVED
jgi:FkbH-like protein